MKKLLFFISVCISFFAKAQTTVYHPFPDSSAVWNFHQSYPLCIGGPIAENYSITFSGDTIINAQAYHKLTTPYVQLFSTGFCILLTSPGYKGAIRQDINSKIVFYVPPSELSEQVLFDFNMVVGDTIKGFATPQTGVFETVMSIDSVLIDNNYRKRWIINPFYNVYFIEGIGSSYGLIEKLPGLISDQIDFSLTCFKQNGNTLYPDASVQCDLITSVEDPFGNAFSATVFPNPIQTSASMHLNPDWKKSEIKIYNSLGSCVHRETIIHQSVFTFNRNALPDGIYFIQVENEKGDLFSQKIILD